LFPNRRLQDQPRFPKTTTRIVVIYESSRTKEIGLPGGRTSGGGRKDSVDLGEIAASAVGRTGAIWTLEGSVELNANLVRFHRNRGVVEHINHEVDVIMVGVSGAGVVEVNGEEHPVQNGTMVFVPRGARRSTQAVSANFAYLSVHRRRGPLQIGG